jgi:YD repeat-containing protein
VTSLTTPYGTSRFSDMLNSYDPVQSNTRLLTLTDPLGFTDFLYFYANAPGIPGTEPVPTGLTYQDSNFFVFRNTFYWDRHAYPLGVTTNSCGEPIAEDFTKALLTHYFHDPLVGGDVGRSVQGIRPPLERRTWIDYPAQPTAWTGGAFDHPLDVALVLDDSTTRRTHITYNANYLPATVTDPLGRVTKYNYAANNIDLLTVQQETNTVGPVFTTVGTFGTANSQHTYPTYTGPDGKTWTYAYTTLGQINTVTDPNSGVTTWNYDASHRLSTIVNANSQTVQPSAAIRYARPIV